MVMIAILIILIVGVYYINLNFGIFNIFSDKCSGSNCFSNSYKGELCIQNMCEVIK